MKRRNFLKLSAAAALGGAAVSTPVKAESEIADVVVDTASGFIFIDTAMRQTATKVEWNSVDWSSVTWTDDWANEKA